MSKPLPILPHMPWNIKQDIVEAVDYKTRFSLRRCSSEFKTLIDDAKVTYQDLSIRCWYYNTVSVTVIFSENCCKHSHFQWVNHRNYIELAVERVQNILKIPNVRFQKLNIMFQKSYEDRKMFIETKSKLLDGITPVLRSRKLIVEKLVMNTDGNHDDILLFLSSIQPRTLKHICLSTFCNPNRMMILPLSLTKIAETEQWKEAELLSLEQYNHTLPFEKMSHFLSVETHRYDISEEELDYIVDNFLRDNGFEELVVCIIEYDFPALMSYFSKFEVLDPTWTEAQFKVRRGENVCRIALYKAPGDGHDYQTITFFNPLKRPDLELDFLDYSD